MISRVIFLCAVIGFSVSNLLPVTVELPKPLTTAQLQAKSKKKQLSEICQKKKRSFFSHRPGRNGVTFYILEDYNKSVVNSGKGKPAFWAGCRGERMNQSSPTEPSLSPCHSSNCAANPTGARSACS